jgi:hypothetical protein
LLTQPSQTVPATAGESCWVARWIVVGDACDDCLLVDEQFNVNGGEPLSVTGCIGQRFLHHSVEGDPLGEGKRIGCAGYVQGDGQPRGTIRVRELLEV